MSTIQVKGKFSVPLNRRLGESTFLEKLIAQKALVFMCLPMLILMFLFSYLPLFGVITAFQKYEPAMGVFKSDFVGLKNFTNFLSAYTLPQIIRNTLCISLLKLVINFPLCIIFALLLNELKNMAFKRVVQTVSYLPHFISWVVVIGLWGKLLAADGGLVNNILASFGKETISFLSEQWFMWPFAILSETWKETGWSTIIILAALSGIDPTLYEAAKVDGARRFAQVRHITLPGISYTISILLVLSVPGIINANTDQMLVLGTAPVRDVTEVIDTYVIKMGLLNAQYGLATAVGLMKSVLSIILLVIANRAANKITEGGGVF